MSILKLRARSIINIIINVRTIALEKDQTYTARQIRGLFAQERRHHQTAATHKNTDKETEETQQWTQRQREERERECVCMSNQISTTDIHPATVAERQRERERQRQM